MEKAKAAAMVLASFAGDALALGVHWIYDPQRIEREFGRVDGYRAPRPDAYHRTKQKGEFTHYGDQALVLLESLAARGTFDLADFAARWRTLFADYGGYFDKATKGTLANFAAGRGPEASASPSDDLAGAARIAPLVYALKDDAEALAAAARAQTAMTHGDPLTIDTAELFARAALRILAGDGPAGALGRVARDRFAGTPIEAWVAAGIAARGEGSVAALGRFGRSCVTPEALPGVAQLVARHPDDLAGALIENTMAGGDSAARGMAVGMLLGARLGEEAIPAPWLSDMARGGEIRRLLDRIP
jgi:ADP-ribosylglycohydrolase